MNDALYEQLVTRKSRPMDLVIRILGDKLPGRCPAYRTARNTKRKEAGRDDSDRRFGTVRPGLV